VFAAQKREHERRAHMMAGVPNTLRSSPSPSRLCRDRSTCRCRGGLRAAVAGLVQHASAPAIASQGLCGWSSMRYMMGTRYGPIPELN